MKEIRCGNTCEVSIRHRRNVIAYTRCSVVKCEIHIKSLFVRKAFRGKGLSEVLLARVLDFADEQKAARIISYCGSEPYCQDGQIPLDQEIAWYEDHGFVFDHAVKNATPCMRRELSCVV